MNFKLITTVGFVFVVWCSYATTFHVDPISGNNITGNGSAANPWKTLDYLFTNNLIETYSYATPYNSNNPQLIIKNAGAPVKGGDTIILYTGLHGEVFIQNYINNLAITIKAAPGSKPVIKKCHMRAGKNWKFENITFSSEPYNTYINDKLFFLESNTWHGPVSNIEVRGNHIYSASLPWTTANDWVTKVSDAIFVQASNVLVIDNVLENIKNGITLKGNNNNASGNSVINFSADGIRILGSSNLVELNLIKNCYDVDDNHDDAIQSFTTGGLIVDNNVVSKNTIINYDDPNQPLSGPLQGIGCFDGPFNGWIIENNVVSVDHWHGISMVGAINCRINNNTVLDPDLDNSMGPAWISINNDVDISSSNCIVKNNIVNSLNIDSGSNTIAGNNIMMTSNEDYEENFNSFSIVAVGDDISILPIYGFSLSQNSIAVDSGDDQYAPATDIVGTPRPQGTSNDAGAFEYIDALTIEENDLSLITEMSPNPTNGILNFKNNLSNVIVEIYTLHGVLLYKEYYQNLKYVDVSKFPSNMYLIKMQVNGKNYFSKFIKK